MRPNPHPAFLVLPEGRVVGEPKPVNGSEQKVLVVKTPEQIAVEEAKRAAKAKAAAEKKAAEERAAAERKKAAEKKQQQAEAGAEQGEGEG
jgi:membrane protein involved in colicin uptake